jgi:hypothetical protein
VRVFDRQLVSLREVELIELAVSLVFKPRYNKGPWNKEELQ